MTKSMQAWKYLCRNPWATMRELAHDMAWERRATSTILHRMRERGSADFDNQCRWRATEYPPIDLRGMVRGCAIGRAHGGKPEHVLIAVKARKKQAAQYRAEGRLRSRQSPYAGKIALENVWPITLSTSNASRFSNVDNDRKPSHQRALSVGTAEESEAA